MNTAAFLKITTDPQGSSGSGPAKRPAAADGTDDSADFDNAMAPKSNPARAQEPERKPEAVRPAADYDDSPAEEDEDATPALEGAEPVAQLPTELPADSPPDMLETILAAWSGTSAAVRGDAASADGADAPSPSGQALRVPVTGAAIPTTESQVGAADDAAEGKGLSADTASTDTAEIDLAAPRAAIERLAKPEAPSAQAGLVAKPAAAGLVTSAALDGASPTAAASAPPAGILTDSAPVIFSAQSDWRPVPVAPQIITRQIADAVVTTRKDSVEIALSPEELGKVRLIVTGPDRAPHVTVWIERPEVMDLVRRNATILLGHFAEAGLDGAALEFREGDGQREDRPAGTDQRAAGDMSEDHVISEGVRQVVSLARPGLAGERRIDIRL